MKLHTKLLTTILPVATVFTVAPVVVSCSSGSSYVLSNWTQFQTYDSGKDNYVSLDDIKYGAKNACLMCSYDTILNIDVANSEPYASNIYFDLVAHLSLGENGEMEKMSLLKSDDTTWVLKYKIKDKDEQSISFKTLTYVRGKDTDKSIYIKLDDSENSQFKSRTFKSTTVQE